MLGRFLPAHCRVEKEFSALSAYKMNKMIVNTISKIKDVIHMCAHLVEQFLNRKPE